MCMSFYFQIIKTNFFLDISMAVVLDISIAVVFTRLNGFIYC